MGFVLDDLIKELTDIRESGSISADAKIKIWNSELGWLELEEVDLHSSTYNSLVIDAE